MVVILERLGPFHKQESTQQLVLSSMLVELLQKQQSRITLKCSPGHFGFSNLIFFCQLTPLCIPRPGLLPLLQKMQSWIFVPIPRSSLAPPIGLYEFATTIFRQQEHHGEVCQQHSQQCPKRPKIRVKNQNLLLAQPLENPKDLRVNIKQYFISS